MKTQNVLIALLAPLFGISTADTLETNVAAANPDRIGEQVTLIFPGEISIGTVVIRPSDRGAFKPDRWIPWSDHAKAQGIVKAPAGHEIGLNVSFPGLEHLQQLESSEVNAVRMLSMPVETDDDDLERLPRLNSIQEFSLKGCDVTDRGVRHLSRLHNLKILYLQRTQVGNEGVERLTHLKRLERLYLQGTLTGDAGLAAIGALPSLRILHLGGCENISNAGMTGLSQCKALEELGLPNGIGDEGLHELRNHASLRSLTMDGSLLSPHGLSYLESIDGLEQLAIGGGFTAANLEALTSLKNLKQLILFHARAIETKDLSLLKGMDDLESLMLPLNMGIDALSDLPVLPNLVKLQFSGIEVTGEHLNLLNRQPRFGFLDLSFCQLGQEALTSLAAVPYLHSLKLSHSQFTDRCLRGLGNLKGLKVLDLSEAELWDDNLARLSGLKSLQHLDLSRTSVTDEGMKRLTGLAEIQTLLTEGTEISVKGPKALASLSTRNNGLPAGRRAVGEPAPPFQAKTMESAEISLDDFKGKHLLLDFWTTTCAPCLAMQETVYKKLHSQYGASGKLVILGVAFEEDFQAVKRYLKRADLPWDTVFDNHQEVSLSKTFHRRSLSDAILIGPDGRIAGNGLSEAEIIPAVQECLGREDMK